MITETVYIGRDNEISLYLKAREASSADATEQDISASTRMTLKVGDLTIDSSAYSSAFDWTTDGADGILNLDIGTISGLKKGLFRARLTVYDLTYPNGWVWDEFMLNVKEA